MVFSLGGGSGSSSNKSLFSNNVWGPQGDALQTMYGQLPGLYNQTAGFNPQMANFGMGTVMPFMQSFMPGAQGGWNQQMMGGRTGGFASRMNPALQASLEASLGNPSQTSQLYGQIMGGDSSYVDPAIEAMYADANRQLGEGAYKQSDQQAAMRGQSGSNFHAQQRGTAQGNMLSQLGNTAAQMRSGAHLTDLGMKLGIAEQADANKLALQQSLLKQNQAADQNTQNALGGLNQMSQFGMSMFNPWMAMQQFPWMNMMNYANVIGDPTVLGKGMSKGGSNNWNAGGGIG